MTDGATRRGAPSMARGATPLLLGGGDRAGSHAPAPAPDPDSTQALARAVLRGRGADPEVHGVRVAAAVAAGDGPAVFGALADAWIGLDRSDTATRRALLARGEPVLDDRRAAWLRDRVTDGLDAATPLPDPSWSVLTAGRIGTVPLLRTRADDRTGTEVTVIGVDAVAVAGVDAGATADADGTDPGTAPAADAAATAPPDEGTSPPGSRSTSDHDARATGRRRRRAGVLVAAVVLVVVAAVAGVVATRPHTSSPARARSAGPEVGRVTTRPGGALASAGSAPSSAGRNRSSARGPRSTRPARSTVPPPTAPPKATPGPDGADAADPGAADPADALTAIAAAGRPAAERLVGHWVPQIDAKAVGMQLGATRWGPERILAHYRSYTTRFPDALLLHSDDFSGYLPGYWVVVVPVAFDDPSGALAWCRSGGFDRDGCEAQLLTHAPDPGNTARLQSG